jgi:hypothetical protein
MHLSLGANNLIKLHFQLLLKLGVMQEKGIKEIES